MSLVQVLKLEQLQLRCREHCIPQQDAVKMCNYQIFLCNICNRLADDLDPCLERLRVANMFNMRERTSCISSQVIAVTYHLACAKGLNLQLSPKTTTMTEQTKSIVKSITMPNIGKVIEPYTDGDVWDINDILKEMPRAIYTAFLDMDYKPCQDTDSAQVPISSKDNKGDVNDVE